MKILGFVFIGGAIGATLRFLTGQWVQHSSSTPFPWGTLVVNTLGSFLLGLLWAYSQSISLPKAIEAFIIIGGLGAFTTFATYSLDTIKLLSNGNIKEGVLNFFLSNTLSVLSILIGYLIGKTLLETFK